MSRIGLCRQSSLLPVLGTVGLVGLFGACGPAGMAGEPPNGPRLVAAPFDAGTAKRQQRVWAKHLGVDAEITNSIGMKLVLVPAGEFVMGAPQEEEKGLLFEGDELQHRVRITRSFYLGTFEVTQSEYERVMGENPSWHSNKGLFQLRLLRMPRDTSNYPVDDVSWANAVEFCRRLSALPEEKAAGRVYRLPTEAQWEHACRAGTSTAFHFGQACNGTRAACDGKSPFGTRKRGPYRESAVNVGSYAPNAWGLYDMHGNVEEWCADWYGELYYLKSPRDDPTGPESGEKRVLRGGSTYSNASQLRSAFRGRHDPGGSIVGNTGFRMALDP